MLRIAICDDSHEFLERTVKQIEKWSEQIETPTEIFHFDNGDALLSKNATVHMDIIFLDIIMPLLSGMDAAKEIRRNDSAVKILFLTSSPEYALDSYDVKAQGYLLKPVTYEKLKEALDDCLTVTRDEPKSIVLKTDFGFQKIYFYDIEYVEAQNKRFLFYLRTEKIIQGVDSLHTFEERFADNSKFFKCHRSYLVYLPNIDHFSLTEIITKSGRSIPIARGYGKAFKDAYFALMFRD